MTANSLKRRYLTLEGLVVRRQRELEISNVELCARLGLKHPTMISAIRSGKTKLPLACVEQAAAVLQVDLSELYAFYLEQYEPTHFHLFRQVAA